MNRVMVLLVMAALLLGGCNGLATNDQPRFSSSGKASEWGATCATCGAGVRGDYFFNSAEKAVGPGQGW